MLLGDVCCWGMCAAGRNCYGRNIVLIGNKCCSRFAFLYIVKSRPVRERSCMSQGLARQDSALCNWAGHRLRMEMKDW